MVIIVVSDTHISLDFVDTLCSLYPNALFLHAGDSMRSEKSIIPFKTVKGNSDFFVKNPFLIERIFDVGIYMFHGHMFPLNVQSLSRHAKDNNCDIIIHGHTHIPYYEFYDGVHILCPGSPNLPRSGSKPSYAKIEFTNKNDVKVEIIEYGR